MRLDTAGRDVTDSPGLWSEEDCEIVATNFRHPTITSGQHTNGPASIWIRRADVGEWIRTNGRNMHAVREQWSHEGISIFLNTEGTEI